MEPALLEHQDVQYATLLSELVYRAAECKTEDCFAKAKAVVECELGTKLHKVQRHKSGGQRYLVGESDAAIYVAFQGTKHATDWLANLNFFHSPLFHHSSSSLHRSTSTSSISSDSSSTSSSSSARAHVGFIRRANQSALSITALHKAAAAAGKRLVLTGHSLGGAVAALTTVRLLRSLSMPQQQPGSSDRQQAAADPHIRCISFATPAVANTDLLQEVAAAGWDRYITNIILPEDPVVPFVNLLLKAPAASAATASSSSSLLTRLGRSTPQTCSDDSETLFPASTASLRRSDSTGSSLSVGSSSSSSWNKLGELQYMEQPLAVQAAAAGCTAWDFEFSPQQQQQLYGQAAGAPGSGGCALALAGAAGGSEELTSWLAAARGAVQRQRQQRRAVITRSLSESNEVHSLSSSSLCSLQPSAADSSTSWGSSSSPEGGLAEVAGRLEATLIAASAAASQFYGSNNSSNSSSFTDSSTSSSLAFRPVLSGPLGPNRRWHQLAFTKAGVAFLTGALAAGVRCAAAMTAPLLGSHLSFLAFIPCALTAPAALAAVHMVGSAAFKAALPVSHPLGQQFVMTSSGLQPIEKPLKSYPRNSDGLRLKELGGLFPGHRMIAYRRRLVALMQEGGWQQ